MMIQIKSGKSAREDETALWVCWFLDSKKEAYIWPQNLFLMYQR